MIDLGYINDKEYAIRRAQVLAARGYGNYYIQYTLERIGLAEDLVDMAINMVTGALAEEERIKAVMRKKINLDKDRLIRHLSYRGFNMETILRAMKEEI